MIDQPGKYRARCIDNPAEARWGRSRNGNEQIALTFALVDEEGHTTSETIDWVGTFDEHKNKNGNSAADFTIQALRNCGWRTDTLEDLSGINDEEVELDVQWDEYEGKRRLRVCWVNRPGGRRITFKQPLDPAGRKALSARFANLVKGSKPMGQSSQVDDRPDWAR